MPRGRSRLTPLRQARIGKRHHDRHDGNAGAMRAYLQWELDLPGEVARDGLAGFRVAS